MFIIILSVIFGCRLASRYSPSSSAKQVPRDVVRDLLHCRCCAAERAAKHPKDMDLSCILPIFSLDPGLIERARHRNATYANARHATVLMINKMIHNVVSEVEMEK